MSTYDCDGFDIPEPRTEKERAEYKVDMAIRDAALAINDLSRLLHDPLASEYLYKSERSVRSLVHSASDLLIDLHRARIPCIVAEAPKSHLRVAL